ncbi:hypothetical protein A0257_22190 [Hymenobacter psoromatis]|nr:hypothetical protein A0257_22190 [Hymenobacter psoromatis]
MAPTLLPPHPHKRSIVSQLNYTIHRAEALYAAVGFWSVGPDFFATDLVALLRKKDSFCIADIHSPTNVDKLNLFHAQGATRFSLFFKELHPKRVDAFIERHLMHTKMLLFDLPEGKAELWVGSHNFTKQALTGINREASLVIPCHQHDGLYSQALTYLHSIRDDKDCHPFDPNQLDNYKKLQGLPEEEIETGVVLLPISWDSSEWGTPATLAQQLILLVGHRQDERRQFSNIGENTLLAIRTHDLATGRIQYFSAALFGANDIDPNDPGSYRITLSERHLAVRRDSQLPFVAPREEEHAQATLRQFRYWVSLRVLDELPADLEFVPNARPADAEWEEDPAATDLLEQAGMRDEARPYAGLEQLPLASELPAIPDRDTRILLWQQLARQRRYRAAPSEPTAHRAAFRPVQRTSAPPTALADLDQQFAADNLPALRQYYEAPLRAAYYQGHEAAAPDNRRTPQVRKLLKRYRLL